MDYILSGERAPVNVIFLGATRGMGRSMAREMAKRGAKMFLLGRNTDNLAKSAVDLEARGARGTVGHAHCDLEDTSTFGPAFAAAIQEMGVPNIVVVTAGMFGTQEALENDLELARRVLTVNYANTVVFCEHAKKHLLERGGGKLVVFSSVAGDRGRKPVGLYGSSKAGLSHYLESLDHKYRSQGLITVCVKPGFVKTEMTAGLKPPPFSGEPDEVAQIVLSAMNKDKPVVYAPKMWARVMLVIRLLPRFIMRRVGF